MSSIFDRLIRFLFYGAVLLLSQEVGAATLPAMVEKLSPSLIDSDSPKDRQSVDSFIPLGWRIKTQVEGDLNRDLKSDVVVILTKLPKAEVDQKSRGSDRSLMVLFQTERGFRRISVGPKVLWCAQCYGTLATTEGGTPEVKISHGMIIVFQSGGSREALDVTLRFRYDSGLDRFGLIGKDFVIRDRPTGNVRSESINYITRTRLINEIAFDENNGRERRSHRKERIAAIKHFLDDYDSETDTEP